MKYLILGSNGQTASYLIEKLISNGHTVVGVSRKTNHIFHPQFSHLHLDLRNFNQVEQLLNSENPDIVVNLASLSSVMACEKDPETSNLINYLMVVKVVEEIVRYNNQHGLNVSMIHCSSSEMYSGHGSIEVSERLDLNPLSTYGKHKALAHTYLATKRDQGLLMVSNAILFNHESPRRPITFVSQKIVQTARAISENKETLLKLGNVNIRRDWGYAKDYAEALNLMSTSKANSDYVVASGELHSIYEFVQHAFNYYNLELSEQTLQTDSLLIRKYENDGVWGNTNKIGSELGWKAQTNFSDLVRLMCEGETASSKN